MALGRISIPRVVNPAQALPKPSWRGVAIWGAIDLLALNAVGLLVLVLVANLTTMGYQTERLEAQRARWLAANSSLESDEAQLQSLARIEKDARERLRMVPATDFIYVDVPAPAQEPVAAKEAPVPPVVENSSATPLISLLHWAGLQP